mgnify:CR=1 FL=1
MRHLAPNLATLVNLKVLNLSYNNIITLPTSMHRLSQLQEVDLDNNPLQVPPQSVAIQGWSAVRQFLADLEKGSQCVSRNRIMLVGDGGSGKTTLKYALMLHSSMADQQSLRQQVNDHISQLWTTSAPVKQWVREIGGSEETTERIGVLVPSGARDLVQLSPSAIKEACGSNVAVADRLMQCVQFLQPPPERLPSSAEEVRDWLKGQDAARGLGLPASFYEAIVAQKINFAALLKLTEVHLERLDLTAFGDRLNVMDLISSLRQEAASRSSSPSSHPYRPLLAIPHVWTEGIDTQEWRPVLTTVHSDQQPQQQPSSQAAMTIWDFAGQLEYFPAHQFFLSASNSLYVLVVNAALGHERCRGRLMHWLSLIHSSTHRDASLYSSSSGLEAVHVVIVATHTDTEEYSKLKTASGDFFPVLLDELRPMYSPQIAVCDQIFTVDYRADDGGGLEELVSCVCSLNTRIRHTEVPSSYMSMAERLLARRMDKDVKIPVISREQFNSMAESASVNADVVLSTLGAHGFVRAVEDGSLILIDPVSWLSKMASCFVMAAREPGTARIIGKRVREIQGLLNDKLKPCVL